MIYVLYVSDYLCYFFCDMKFGSVWFGFFVGLVFGVMILMMLGVFIVVVGG